MKTKLGLVLVVLTFLALGGCSNHGQVEKVKSSVPQPAKSPPKPQQQLSHQLSSAQLQKRKEEKVRKAKHDHNLQIQKKKQKVHAQHVASAKNSLPYKLATIDNGYVEIGARPVKRFKSLLDQLSSKFVEGPQQISDMTVKAHQLLEDAGISESCEDIMESMNRTLNGKVLADDGSNHQKYAEYISLYVVDRKSGMSQEEIVAGLRELSDLAS